MTYFGKLSTISSSFSWAGEDLRSTIFNKNSASLNTFVLMGNNTTTTLTESNPAVVGQTTVVFNELQTGSIYLRSVLNTSDAASSASIQLYNITSGCYVQLGPLGSTILSTSSPTPVVVESIDLMYANGFDRTVHDVTTKLSTSNIQGIPTIYELRLFAQTGSQSASLGSSMLVGNQNPGPFNPYNVYGTDLILWLRTDNSNNVVLKTIGEWKDQSPTGLLFANSTQANRPLYSSGVPLFDATNDALLDLAGTSIGAENACTVVYRDTLTNVPVNPTHVASWAHILRQNSTPDLILSVYVASGLGYLPWVFHAGGDGLNSVGVNVALDTNTNTRVWTWNGGSPISASSYTARINHESVIVTGSTSNASNSGVNSVGGRNDFAAGAFDGTIHGLVVYDSVLSAADQVTAETLMDNVETTSTYADFAALGNIVCCLLPNIGQSGDAYYWYDQSPNHNDFFNAVLADEAYYDLDDTVADLSPSMIFDGSTDKFASEQQIWAADTKMTWSWWVYQTTFATPVVYISKATSTGPDYSFFIQTYNAAGYNRLVAYIMASASDVSNYCLTDSAIIPANTWAHIAVVYDGTAAAADRVKIYKNGALQPSTITGTIPTSMRISTAASVVGGYDGLTATLPGRMDDVISIRRALSATEIRKLATYYTRSGAP